MDEVYPKIGAEHADGVAVFELVLKDHVTCVDPSDFGLPERKWVNPAEYFITSGDAVEKAKVLEKDMWAMAGELQKELLCLIAADYNCDNAKAKKLLKSGIKLKKLPKFGDFVSAVWKCAGQCRRLLNALAIAKGDNCFLETERAPNHALLCIPKNPRK